MMRTKLCHYLRLAPRLAIVFKLLARGGFLPFKI